MSDNEKFELDRNENPMNYSTGMPSDWRFGGSNLANSSVGLVSMGDSMNGDSSSCSSASMVDSFGPRFWDPPTDSQNLGFCGITSSLHNNGSSSNMIGMQKDHGFGFGRGAGHDHGTLEMGLNQGMFPEKLSQFPADSGFIERAARFSCFGGGIFADMVNAYGIPQSMGMYAATGVAMHGARDALTDHVLKSMPQEGSLMSVGEAAKDVSPSIEASPLKNDETSESHIMSPDEGRQALVRPTNESERAESSDVDDSPMLEGTNAEPSIKGFKSNKRKRIGLDANDDKVNDKENKEKGDQQTNSATKPTGKNNAKQGSQASDPPKEEYIHVRAPRGQATNSHSLAERVRREKISERMKFLQDLVPGCSKVTGKAVMLDEIINYVQSLQRQVEFLSMKLATVNPRLDFNIEGHLPKDILRQQPGPPSALGFPLEMSMAFPPLYPSQAGLIQSAIPSMNPSDVLRRTVRPQLAPLSIGGFKEPNQLPDGWDDELHNVVQMSFATTAPMSSQNVDGTAEADQMKVEL